ncbi:hypothetical protein WHR41_05848 [Cladosporium halotolerans]|uniref:Zn(2)-C6 fungal-type domain-containing protein n=1 Tax=Cladosporium halotolerans TaxID=1052096 RepID=A0AB34KMI0_9PEZI
MAETTAMDTTAPPPEPTRTPSRDGADATPTAGTKRKRQPRNSACQSCAALKMKCIATAIPGVCERCNRMSRDCLPSIPKPRKRQSINGLSEPEIRSLPLSHILGNDSPPRQISAYPPAPGPAGEVKAFDAFNATSTAKPDATHNGSFTSLFAHGLGLDEQAESSFELLAGVDFALMHDSFGVFERMVAHVPFIELPNTDVMKMVVKRPVTALAICIAAMGANADLRLRLVEAFRRAVSIKCIVNGERSIDLMSGLLIHITWHHRYMHRQQIYQLMHLVAGMAADHGLYRQSGLEMYSSQQPDRETQLLFLGSHYMFASLAGIGSCNPSPLGWNNHLYDVAKRFSFNGPFPNNSNNTPFVELGRLLGDIDSSTRDSSESFAAPSHNRTWATWHNSKADLQRLEGLTQKYPVIATHPHVQATRIAIYTIMLQNAKEPQTSALTDIALAIKDYFDTTLNESVITINHMSIIDWIHLLSVLAALILILHPQFETWEAVPGALRNLLEPEHILDAIVARMNAVSPAQQHPELMNWFAGLASKIKGKWQHDRYSVSRGRTGSGDVSESEARFRPVNARASFSGDRVRTADSQGPGGGFGACDVDVGHVCKIDLLEDSFWDRLLRS